MRIASEHKANRSRNVRKSGQDITISRQGLPMMPRSKGRRSKRRSGEWDAYLTVFLSLCLPVILTFLLALLEGARIGAIRLEIEVAADTAADSVLAEYHKELMEQYDLLMIDTSYGTDSPSISNTEDQLTTYMEQNLSISGSGLNSTKNFTGLTVTALSVSGTRFAADNDCQALREQIYAYYSSGIIGAAAAEWLSYIDTFQGLSLDSSEWSALKAENEVLLKEKLEDVQENVSSESDSSSGDAEVDSAEEGTASEDAGSSAAAEAQSYVESQGGTVDFAEGIYSMLNQLLSLPVLTQVLGGSTSLSQAEVEAEQLISGRTIHIGDGAEAENSHDYEEADTIIFDLYAFEKCGSYINQMDKSVLKYQVEYLLYGKDSDIENLEKTAETLLMVRLAANMITITQDSERMALAERMGAALAILCAFQEELQPVFTTAIVLIWTYMESLQDVRSLLEGGSVPLVKSSSEWKTDLSSIFNGTDAVSSDGGGLNYEAYLHILLFLEDGDVKNLRLLNLMEMDIRATEGNEDFQMDWCMDTFTVEAVVSSSYGYAYTVRREASYN